MWKDYNLDIIPNQEKLSLSLFRSVSLFPPPSSNLLVKLFLFFLKVTTKLGKPVKSAQESGPTCQLNRS